MKNLSAELMWLESTKKQVEIAKDAYREAKIHLLNSLKDTDTVVVVDDHWNAVVKEEVDRVNNTIKLCEKINKDIPGRYCEFDIDELDIYPVTDENGNITVNCNQINW